MFLLSVLNEEDDGIHKNFQKTTKGIIFEGNAKNVKMLLIPGVESDWGIPR